MPHVLSITERGVILRKADHQMPQKTMRIEKRTYLVHQADNLHWKILVRKDRTLSLHFLAEPHQAANNSNTVSG